MEKIISQLSKDNPGLTFVKGQLLCWSPENKQIFYDPTGGHEEVFGVLHELGHARLQHKSYSSDIDLLKKESLAWEEALKQAKKYGIALDWDHVQDCLDSYRNWLHKRSTCPTCGARGIQPSEHQYSCLNCRTTWKVTSARFCRPYRLIKLKVGT